MFSHELMLSIVDIQVRMFGIANLDNLVLLPGSTRTIKPSAHHRYGRLIYAI